MIHITGFGEAVAKAEGQSVDYEARLKRTPEEMIEYLKQQLHLARIEQSRYRRVKRIARNQKLMIANKDGFTLVEDLDDYMENEQRFVTSPLTRQDILREAQEQLEDAFRQGYIQNYTGPKVTP